MKGSKRQRASGSWELRAYNGRDPVTGRESWVTRTYRGGARQADNALRAFVKEVEDGELGGTSATVSALLERWMVQVKRHDRSPTTIREYQRIIDKTLVPSLGPIQIRKLTAAQVDELYGSMIDRGLRPASVRQAHAVLRAAMKQAVKWGWVPANVVENASPPSVVRAEVTAPTAEQVMALIQHAEKDEPEMAALIALAATTGARRGELCALRWGDWRGETLTIRRSIAIMGRGERVTKGTKTHANRTVALDEVAAAVLNRHLAYARREARHRGVDEPGPDSPIISFDFINPISPDTATHYVKAAADACGFRTHLHALRHFSGTQMIADGVNVRTVAERLGHADASTTLRIYAHALPEKDREAAAVLGRALTPRALAP